MKGRSRCQWLAPTLLFINACGAGCGHEWVDTSKVLRNQTIDFGGDAPGKMPASFTTALTGGGGPVAWVVREDKSAPRGKVLVQESADDTSYRFPLCIYDRGVMRDGTVQVQYKALAGSIDQAGGVVLRYHPENYYIARANALEDNIDLFKTVNGKRDKIKEAEVKVSAKQWHTLALTACGNHLTVSFDGKVAIEADDDTFPGAGNVGLWTKADSVSAFADFKIIPTLTPYAK